MSDPIVCGAPGDDFVAEVKCPDCGTVDADVVEYDRFEGVMRARCPRCEAELWTCGTVPFDYDPTGQRRNTRVRRKSDAVVVWTDGTPQGQGDDDGE